MKSLYETLRGSILSDIDDTLDLGDAITTEYVINAKNSEARKFFNIPEYVENPFTIKNENGAKTLICNHKSSDNLVLNKPNQMFDVIGEKIDKIILKTLLDIYSNNISEDICKSIQAPVISIYSNNIKDVNFSTIQTDVRSYFPNINITSGEDSIVISNSEFNIDYKYTSSAKLNFVGNIPIFKNVKSNIRDIEILDRGPIIFSSGNNIADIFGNPVWNNIFEFNYTINSINKKTNKSKSIKIKNMMDIRKLVASTKFYETSFSEWPYRIKEGSKLIDFLDISKFKDLRRIRISDDKVNIIFYKSNKFSDHVNPKNVYFYDMLKPDRDPAIKKEMHKHIPVTSDGWEVIIAKK